MEHRVLAELDKHMQTLATKLKSYGLGSDVISEVNSMLLGTVESLIQLMREGKNAHEKFFSDIILNSVDAIIGIDNEFKIFLWNKGAEEIFSYVKEEVIGRDFSFLIPESLLSKGERDFLINEVKDKGFIVNHESERLTKEGKVINISLTRFMIYDEKKQPIGSVGIIRDLTKVKKLEKELREKENLALIGEVVSSIAHSLSNPLNIISGNADYLLLDRKENDKDYEELRTILDETSRITKSIRHLLNFSRPITVHKQKGDLNAIITSIVGKSKYIIGEKNIALKKSLGENITGFLFDNNEIEEVIMNIVTNAVQAIQMEGEIKIRTSLEADIVKIEITDNGPGIPKENLSKIFLPFFSSKEFGKGTGLGLSIAKRIIKEHNGDINVRSQFGKGTSFFISLPYTQ